MPDVHTFRPTVTSTGLLERAKQWREQTDTDWPHGLGEAWQWSVRNVSTGSDVASGFAPSFEEARDAAAKEQDQAEDRDAARVLRELGIDDVDLVRGAIADQDRDQ